MSRIDRRSPRRASTRRSIGLGAGLLGLMAIFASRDARAQVIDLAPPPPNILLLVDSSGSMELMMDGSSADASNSCVNNHTSTACACTNTAANRWGVEMQAIAGSLGTYGCIAEDRAARENSTSGMQTPFDQEFALLGASPYDTEYYLPFHRPAQPYVGASCPAGHTCYCVRTFDKSATTGWDPAAQHPDAATVSLFTANPGEATLVDFGKAGIERNDFVFDVTTKTMTTSTCTFAQNNDGLLGISGAGVRYALMTYDSDPAGNLRSLSGSGAGSGGVTTSLTGVTVSASNLGMPVFNLNATGTPPATDNTFAGMWSYYSGWESNSLPGNAAQGKPGGCDPGNTTEHYFEVGARSPAAPPWEGRMIRFPDPQGGSPDVNQIDTAIKDALTVMRPYGANPISGMLDDAKQFLWADPYGPKDDPFITGGCRDQYILLLTHAAPNDDLYPYCQQGSTADGGTSPGVCPYDKPENYTLGLAAGAYSPTTGAVPNVAASAATGKPVKTFVIGMAPATEDSTLTSPKCSDVLQGTAPNYTLNTTLCPASGSTDSFYKVCCQLAMMAINGGTGQPYFADTAADLGAAFNAIVNSILASTTTRTPPVVQPQTSGSYSSAGGSGSAVFLTSLNVSTVAPWTGTIQRERLQCSFANGTWGSGSTPLLDQRQAIDTAQGDDFQFNLDNNQTATRHVMVVSPYSDSTATYLTPRSTGTIRMYVNGPGAGSEAGLAFDNLDMYDGKEFVFDYIPSSATTVVSVGTSWTAADGILPQAVIPSLTCPATAPGTGSPGTPFDLPTCETLAFNYALGAKSMPAGGGAAAGVYNGYPSAYTFPARYYQASDTPIRHPLGDAFHSVPAVVTPPSGVVTDDSYQAFVQRYNTGYTTANNVPEPRHTVLYVATNDGLLHAFGVDYNASDDYTFHGQSDKAMNEMWSFIPPAAMSGLNTQYLAVHQLLNDGSPVVKDTVYDRTSTATASNWHTTLVASLGSGYSGGRGGFYALDVTDPDISQRGSAGTVYSAVHTTANGGLAPYLDASTGRPHGPHFLWQLNTSGSSDALYPMFGDYGATPAIGTVVIKDSSSVAHEVGVAFLPGGATNPLAGVCGRSPNTAITGTTAKLSYGGPSDSTYAMDFVVRAWQPGGCTGKVKGRSFTVVRLDTGEIIRTFMREDVAHEPAGTIDAPAALLAADNATSSTNAAGYHYTGRVTDTQLDSPMTGTPAVYPSDVGADAQKVYVSDADGTIWRFDVSSPDPTQWYGEVYFDSFNVGAKALSVITSDSTWALSRAPLASAPILSLGRDGTVVLNFATSNPSNVGVYNTGLNQFVYSLSETVQTISGDPTPTRLRAQVNWYMRLPNDEMAMGPGTVFDGTYYFSTYAPASAVTACQGGTGRLWGMDYVTPLDPTSTTPNTGGTGRLPDPNGGTTLVQSIDEGGAVIPGVTILPSLVCATGSTGTDQYASGQTHMTLDNVQPATYSPFFTQGAAGSGKGGTGAVAGEAVKNTTGPTSNGGSARAASFVDSWAAVVE